MVSCFHRKSFDRTHVSKDLWYFPQIFCCWKTRILRAVFFNLKIFISLWILELCCWNFTEIKYYWVLDSCKVSATELKYSKRYEDFSRKNFILNNSVLGKNTKIFISLWILELCCWNYTGIKYSNVLDFCKISVTELKYSQRSENFSVWLADFLKKWPFENEKPN